MFLPDIIIYQFFINEFSEVARSSSEILKSIGLLPKTDSRRKLLASRSQVLANAQRFGEIILEKSTGKPSAYRASKSLLKYYKAGENNIYSPERLAQVQYYLEGMKQKSQDIGAEFICLFVPGAIAVSQPEHIAYFPWGQDIADPDKFDMARPLRQLKEITDPLEIKVVDLTPLLKNHKEQPVYYPRSWHWNREGHKIVANKLLEVVVNMDSQQKAGIFICLD